MNNIIQNTNDITSDEWYNLGIEMSNLKNEWKSLIPLIFAFFGTIHPLYKLTWEIFTKNLMYLRGDLDTMICYAYPDNQRVLPGYDIDIISVFYRLRGRAYTNNTYVRTRPLRKTLTLLQKNKITTCIINTSVYINTIRNIRTTDDDELNVSFNKLINKIVNNLNDLQLVVDDIVIIQ